MRTLIEKKNSFFVVTLMIFAVVASTFTSFALPALTNSSAAFADGCGMAPSCSSGPEISVGITAPGGGGGNSGGGGAGGGGSDSGNTGGGTVTPPDIRYINRSCWGNGVYPAGQSVFCSIPAGPLFITCAPRNGAPATAVTIKFDYNASDNGSAGKVLSYTCKYPPAPNPNTVKGVKTCFIQYDSQLRYSTSKNTIRSGGNLASVRKGANQYKGVKVGVANYNRCTTNFNANQNYFPQTPEKGGYGYYRATATNVMAVTCRFIGYPSWTNNSSRDRYTCSSPYNSGITANNYAVYSCATNFRTVGPNWSSLPNANFSLAACSKFTCTLSQKPTLNGVTTGVEVMRNGENVSMVLPTARITGDGTIRNVKNVQGITKVVSGSSPYNTAADVNGTNQYFQYRAADGKTQKKLNTWENHAENKRNIAFFWASDSGKQFKMDRTYRFTAQFLIFVADGTNGGGSRQWQTATYTYTAGSSCYTKIPPMVVLRSVNK